MNNTVSSEFGVERYEVRQQAGIIAMLVFYIFIFVVGLMENSLVLVVVFGKKESKTVNDIFITNLTISDIAFITVASPLGVYIYFAQQYGSTFVCKIGFPMITATYFVSIATVASMAIQRSYAIRNPFKQQIKKHRLIMWLVGIWCLSLVLVIPQTIVTNVSPTQSCHEEWSSKTYAKLYTVSLFALQYVFPLAVIGASYIRIAIYVSGSNCNSRQFGINVQNKKRAKDEKAIKRTIIIILVAFLLCMLPNQVAYFLLDFGSVDQKRAAIALLDPPAYLEIPTYFHSCVNPIIYGAVFRQFREGYARYVSSILHFLCGKSCGRKNNHSPEKASVEGLATRRRRGLERVELNEQVLMEDNFVDLTQAEHGRGLTGDVSFGNVVLESNV